MGAGESTPTVLVVDDDQTTLSVIQALLEDAGYRVAVRSEALGTTAQIQQTEPDFVLLDVNMPALTGDRIARVLSRGERLERTRLVFYSGRPAEELERLARTHGAHGWIRKGSDNAAFVREFERLVADAAPDADETGSP
jgi:CheY-like chemotaxis protein